MASKRFKVGALQHSGLEIYVFDPVFDDCPAFDGDYDAFPGSFDPESRTLHVDMSHVDRACRRLNDASNSADDDGDNELAGALASLMCRVRRAGLPHA